MPDRRPQSVLDEHIADLETRIAHLTARQRAQLVAPDDELLVSHELAALRSTHAALERRAAALGARA